MVDWDGSSLRQICECEYCRTGKATTHNDASHDQSLFSDISVPTQDRDITLTFTGGTTKCARMSSFYFTTVNPIPFNSTRVIELGAGTGLVGLSLCLLGAKVMLTDQEPVMETLEANISRNAHVLEEHRISTSAFYWGDPVPESVTEFKADVVVGSDLIFAKENIPMLLKAIDGICSIAPSLILYYAHIDRFGWEESFFKGMEERRFSCEKVYSDVDVHLFKFTVSSLP